MNKYTRGRLQSAKEKTPRVILRLHNEYHKPMDWRTSPHQRLKVSDQGW